MRTSKIKTQLATRIQRNKPEKKWSVVAKCAFCAFLATLVFVAPFSGFENIVYADNYQNFKGTEKADNDKMFDSKKDQNIYKMWSVFKSYGLTDEEAVALIAQAKFETVYSFDVLEGDYSNNFISKMRSKYPGLPGKGEELLKKYNTDKQFRYDWSEAVMSFNGSKNRNAYLYKGDGTCGIGILQWTGERNVMLRNFAQSHSANWWDAEVQLSFMFDAKNGDKYHATWLAGYKVSHKNKDIGDCVSKVVRGYMGCVGQQSRIDKSTGEAMILYYKLHGKGWDSNYGAKVLSGAGIKAAKFKTGIQDVTIQQSLITPGINYPWNSGFLTTDNSDAMDARNKEVYEGYVNSLLGQPDESKKYSLFELYGEDLHWYRYMGESTAVPGLGDHIYSAYTEDKLDLLALEVIERVDYKNTNYLSTRVYPNRPRTLTKIDKENGYTDPRVDVEGGGMFNGYLYVQGSNCMTIAKFVSSFVSMLTTNELIDKSVDIITKIEETTEFEKFVPTIFLLCGFGILGLMASLVKKAIFIAKADSRSSMTDIIIRFIVGLFCIGFILCMTLNPGVFNKVIKAGLGLMDNVFNAALADAFKNDEVIAVEDDSMATRAVIWKTCIFNPWCRGQFGGLEYNELYTNYATLQDGQKAMAQSNQTIKIYEENPDMDRNVPYYNSTQLTGDVYVPVGGGKKIRNWAAFLYSCGSKYHIDATLNDASDADSLSTNVVFPMAQTTAYNHLLYADTFRVVDAQMNISPQYYKDGSVIYNYTDAHQVEYHFGREGFKMIINAALLLFLIPAIWQKIKNFLLLMLLTFECIYFSFIELFKEGTGLRDIGDRLKKSIAGYFLASLKIYCMITLYAIFVDKNFVMSLLYCLLCLTILSVSVNDINKFAKNTTHKAMLAIENANAKQKLKKDARAK